MVTDLTNTTWYFNGSITGTPYSTYVYYLDFKSNGQTFDTLWPRSSSSLQYLSNGQTTNAYSYGWKNEAYRTVTITGGQHTTNEQLIAWFEREATQVLPAEYTIQYSTAHGIAPPSKTVTEGYELTSEDLPSIEAEGWEFLGWNRSVGYVIGEDTTITARWREIVPPAEPNLFGNRFKETYTYKRVSSENWQEHETYDFITNGSIERSTSSDLKETGSFDFEGYELPNVKDLLRIYYSFEDDDGVYFSEPVGTFFVSYSKLTHIDTMRGIKSTGTLDGASVLNVLANKKVGLPFTVGKNENPVYIAEAMVRECGLLTDLDNTSYAMGKPYTFDAGTNYLEICNTLLGFASYRPLFPDTMGVVQLRQAAATSGEPKFVFRNDEKSIMYPEIEEENDWQKTPNRVVLLYNTTDACLYAEATNVSGSRSSVEQRGCVIDHFEEISDLGDMGSKLNNILTLSETMLKEKSADVEYVTHSHAYVPINIYDLIGIEYGDKDWTGNVDDMQIELSPSTKCTTKIKRVLEANIEIESDAKVVR